MEDFREKSSDQWVEVAQDLFGDNGIEFASILPDPDDTDNPMLWAVRPSYGGYFVRLVRVSDELNADDLLEVAGAIDCAWSTGRLS